MKLSLKCRCPLIKTIGTIAIAFLSFLAGHGQESKPAPSPAPGKIETRERSTGSISGSVSDDGGHPIANANVMIVPLSSFNAVSKSEGTDENGKFSVKDLASGTYRIVVQAPAYVQTDDDTGGPDGLPKFYRIGDEVSFTLEKGGVITGTVIDPSGVPVVGLSVTAIRIRQPDETSFSNDTIAGMSRTTDDRGIYRLYGLRSGRYLVYAGSSRNFSPRPGPFDRDSPTYYPSSTRDTASVIVVQTGQEVPGIDIRYRGDRGYAISGTLTGVIGKVALLSLMVPGNPTPVGAAFSPEQDGRNAFAFTNVPNGEFKIVAFSSDDKTRRAASGTMNVSVKNGDVEGMVIVLKPLSSIAGHFVLTAPFEPKCKNGSVPGLEQTAISVQPEKNLPENIFSNRMSSAGADPNGEFSIRGLSAGNYRLHTSLPTADWYIRSIDRQPERAPQNRQPSKTASPAESITLSSGENLSGLSLVLANGAGSLDGHVVAEQATEQPPPRRIYLVPSEKERADDTLRFSETAMASDGTFSFRNLAPGRYFLASRSVKDADDIRPHYWDGKERALLIAEANGAGLAVEIKPCQSIKDLAVKFGPNGMIK